MSRNLWSVFSNKLQDLGHGGSNSSDDNKYENSVCVLIHYILMTILEIQENTILPFKKCVQAWTDPFRHLCKSSIENVQGHIGCYVTKIVQAGQG